MTGSLQKCYKNRGCQENRPGTYHRAHTYFCLCIYFVGPAPFIYTDFYLSLCADTAAERSGHQPAIPMKKIVIAIDSFKGSVSSQEAATACAQGVRRLFPDCETVCIPVADGGEGTVTALVGATGGRYIRCQTHDPLMRPIESSYGILGDGRTVVIELAAASGLHLLTPEAYDPMKATTYGTGELIRDALRRGYRDFLIGLGGSATNDAGTGILQALGILFSGPYGVIGERGGKILSLISSADTSGLSEAAAESRFTLLSDVDNPFTGPQGAVSVFASQKGASAEMKKELEEGMKRFARLTEAYTEKDIDTVAGSGAAGGTAGGLLAFLPAQIRPGIDTLLEINAFGQQLAGADLVITGEGKIDRQTLRGKVPSGILRIAQQARIPVVALAGTVEAAEPLNEAGFLAVLSIQTAPVSLEQALEKERTLDGIRQTTVQCMRLFSARPQEETCKGKRSQGLREEKSAL